MSRCISKSMILKLINPFSKVRFGVKEATNQCQSSLVCHSISDDYPSNYVAHSLECFCIVAKTDSILCQKIASRASKRHI
jgi:hypothetical protein